MATKNLTPKAAPGKAPQSVLEDWSPFASLRTEMDRLFDSYAQGFDMERFMKMPGMFNPKIDITDAGKSLNVNVELPGMDEKDIELGVTKESLTIKGEKREEKEEKEKNYYRMERSYGSFNRTIPLPAEIETEKVEATYAKGVLRIVLPKTERAIKEMKQIAIKRK